MNLIERATISKKIVLFGQRRNGTTMAFNLFRQIPALRCYYEPFHPKLLKNAFWHGVTEIERDAKAVYGEYEDLYPEIIEYYCPLGAPVFPIEQELEAKYFNKKHTRYLKYLFSTAKNVLIQPVRVNYHLRKIYSEFTSAKFIWILRSPEGVVSSLMKRHPNMFELKIDPFGKFNSEYFTKILNKVSKVVLRRNYVKRSNIGHWSQDLAADYLIENRKRYNRFKNYPLWFRLLLTWYDSVDSVERTRQLIPTDLFAVVRYEDVCRDPNGIMVKLCDWLEIDLPLMDFRELVYKEPAPVFMPEDKRWQWAKEEISEIQDAFAFTCGLPIETKIGVR